MPKLAFEWQRFAQFSAPALYELLRFRQQIFVVEQSSPYPDLDGLDHAAWHLLLRVDGELAGCLRLALSPNLRIGRVAVAPSARGQGLGRRLMAAALAFCREHYPAQSIALTAQLHLVRFYQSFGFAATSEPYDDFGLAHIHMRLAPP
ncbi:MAG TPA: GNAT family N-acetyltransferase [Stellaceae bacterium]|jgi:ElaA protein